MALKTYCTAVAILLCLASCSSTLKEETCDEPGTFCSSDCKNLILCLDDHSPPQVIDCGSHNSTSKYCERTYNSNGDLVASCTAEEPSCNPPERGPYLCVDSGEFPEPFFCTSTYYCPPGETLSSLLCSCPPGLVVDVNTLECVSSCNQAAIDCSSTTRGNMAVNETSPYCYNCRNGGEAWVAFCPGEYQDPQAIVGNKTCQKYNSD